MKYMGSKRELLPDIREAVKKLSPNGTTLLDIFAGSCSVGTYLKDEYTIFSNDIQSYSRVISDALICSGNLKKIPDLKKSLDLIKNFYLENLENLEKFLKTTLFKSDEFTNIEKGAWDEKKRINYLNFFESFPSPLNEFKSQNEELQKLTLRYFSQNKLKKGDFPYFQTCFLFPEVYFSLRQCIEIDSIRYGIDKTFSKDVEKNIALSALLYAHSYCSSGTGHFAMFRDLDSLKSIEDVFIYRKRNVWSYFENKFSEILDFCSPGKNTKHKSFVMDYKDLLNDKKIMTDVNLVYADPPYSFVHYSRFYHATESLINYDFDIPQFKGRYRTDRHQSPFCQKQNVEKAFEFLIEKCQQFNCNILFSYSDTGMIELQRIKNLLSKYDFQIEIKKINYDHSTMGRSGHKNNQITEFLILATRAIFQ